MTKKRIAWTPRAVFGVLFVLSSAFPDCSSLPRHRKRCPWAEIIVAQDARGVCVVQFVTKRITAYPRDIVHWDITNRCDKGQRVKVGPFAPQDPFESSTDERLVKGKGTTVELSRTVRSNAVPGKYLYTVSSVGGQSSTMDPEMEIERP